MNEESVLKLLVVAAIVFIASSIPTAIFEPKNEIAQIVPVIFGLFLFLLGLTLNNTFEIDKLKKQKTISESG